LELFEGRKPLPARLRPEDFSEFVGQEHIVGKGKPLRRLVEKGELHSLVFYGPPGTGKTALARLISRKLNADFHQLNAVTSTVSEVRRVLEKGRENRKLGRKTILFIDEIHRFNKTQQDALLPDTEEGNVILIGATTENPYFSLTPALRSRVKIYHFKPLSRENLLELYRIATTKRDGLPGFKVPEKVLNLLINASAGDGRKFLNYLEELHTLTGGKEPTLDLAREVVGEVNLSMSEDDRFDLISALIKSMRGSDPDAALHYAVRLLEAGEDPKFIARRLVIFASEDVGNANPEALLIANAALNAVINVGMPEAAINLAHAVIYLSTSLKSNAVYKALKEAQKDVKEGFQPEVPPHLKAGKRNRGYRYPHNYERNWVEQEYLKEKRKYYRPKGIGFEKVQENWLSYMRGETDKIEPTKEKEVDDEV